MMCPDELITAGAGNWKQQTMAWLFSQGASTVLLCGILGFLGYRDLKLGPELDAKRIEESKQSRADFTTAIAQQRADLQEANKATTDGLRIAIDRLADKIDVRK